MTQPRALLAYDYFIRYVTGLAQGFRANGWEPILLSRRHDVAFGGEPGAMRRYVEHRLGPEQRSVYLSGRVREPSGWRSGPRLRRQVRDFDANVTHVQTCVSNDPRLALVAGLRPRRYALTVHDVEVHPGDVTPPRYQTRLASSLLHHAGLVFVHADSLRDQVIERGLARAPVVVIPHGVDDAQQQPLPAEPSLLFFGRISAYKGLPVLFEAVERLWRRRPQITLTVAGEGQLPEHRALTDGRVRLLHRHIAEDEVPALYASASVVVLPYIHASQSGVGSLAKGYGRAMIASAVGGLPELLADGSGELVTPGDPTALAEKLDELLDDPARLQRMGNAGRRSVLEHTGWPIVARLTLDAYERYLGVPVGLADGSLTRAGR